MVTMKQIANRAGVSISTVSLVLNNRDIGRVSPDVAERVRDIAAELG
ncbi:LacI family transcriptional regulator, partial [Bifidobacterium bifidum]